MLRIPHHNPRSDDDRLAPLPFRSRVQFRLTPHHNLSSTTVNSMRSQLSGSSGVQSQNGARWREDFATTVNSGFGNTGTPRSMNRKPVREGRERAVGQKPLPETLRRALGLKIVTEEDKEDKKMRELQEQAEDYHRMLRRIRKQRDMLEESQKKLDSEVILFINRGSLEQLPGRKNDLKDLRTTIRELREYLDNYEATVRTNEHRAAAQDLYNEQFATFIADTKKMRGLVNSTAKRLNRHVEVVLELTPKQKILKKLSTETRGERAGSTFSPELGLPQTSLNQQESFRSREEVPTTVNGEESEVSPAEKPPDLAKRYEHKTVLEDTIRKKITGIAEESNSLMAQLVHLIPAVMAHVGKLEEPNNYSRCEAIHARLISIESHSNNLRNKLMMGTPELETGRLMGLYFDDLVTVIPNVEALCRAVSGLRSALPPKRDQKTKKNQPSKCKEIGGPRAVYRTCASEEETDDDQSNVTLVEYDYACEKSANEASPPSLSALSLTLVDTMAKGDPKPALGTTPAFRPLFLVDAMAEEDLKPTMIITSTLQSLFDQSTWYQALQKTLIPEVAVLECCTSPWSFSRKMQVKGLFQTLNELLKNATELRNNLEDAQDVQEAASHEDEDGDRELIATIKQHFDIATEMKSEVSAMIRSVLYSEHCQQKLNIQEKETPIKSL